MSNQSKNKYAKFITTAATATLVASAIVPVASAAPSFPDVKEGNSHAEAINALVEAGIIKGYEDGTFGPNNELTRGHVVKMLGKWVEQQEGFEIPADWNSVQRFDDLKVDIADEELVKYAALLKDNGVFIGSNGELNASDNISRENMALTLDRAYKAVFGTSLVDLAADVENVTVSDLNTAKEEAREEIQAMRNLSISNVAEFSPKKSVTRAQFASFLNRTIEVEGSVEAASIESLNATAVNELTVKFDGAVNTEAAQFAVTRGTSNIAVSDVEWNESKTEAVITVATKFVDATYTLTVNGVAKDALTKQVTTKAEEPTSMAFLSNALVLTGETENGANVAKIPFEVYNQYGEDITEDILVENKFSVDVKGIDEVSAAVSEQGIVKVLVDADEDEGTTGTIELAFEDGDIEFEISQEVTLSEQSEPGTVEFAGIYNDNDKAFTAKEVEKNQDDYYVLFSVTDQYGVEIDADPANSAAANLLANVRDGLRIDVSNDNIFDVADESQIVRKSVNGKHYFAIPLSFEMDGSYLKETGENTVTIKSRATGEVATANYTLEDSSKVAKIELSQPAEIVAGNEEVKVPVKVTNQADEAYTNVAKLNELLGSEIQISGDTDLVNGGFSFEEENGQIFLVFTTKTQTDKEAVELDLEVSVESFKNESSITLEVEQDAFAKTLVKLADNVVTSVYEGHSIDIEPADFVIEDQYGREFDDADFTIAATSLNNNFSVTGSNNSFTINSVKEGSATVDFVLTTTANTSVNSKLSVTFTTVDDTNFESYKVDSSALVDGKTSIANEVTVYGVLSNGVEVELPNTAYQVVAGDNLELNANNEIVADADAKAELAGKAGINTLDASFEVIINENATTLTHNVTITEEKAKMVTVEAIDESSVSEKELTSFDFNHAQNITAANILTALDAVADLTFEDQFAKEYDLTEVIGNVHVTFSNVNDANNEFTIDKNGATDASISDVEAGGSFTVTLKVDGVAKAFNVNVK